MLSILFVENRLDAGIRCKRSIEAEGFTIEHCMDYGSRLAILNYMEQKKPDVVILYDEGETPVFCVDVLLTIRENGYPVSFLLAVKTKTPELVQIALDCDVEWIFSAETEGDMVPRALFRILRRKNALHAEREERIKQSFCEYVTGQRMVPAEEVTSVFQEYLGYRYYQIAVVRILPPYRRRFLLDENNLMVLKGFHILRERLSREGYAMVVKNGMDILLCLVGNTNSLHFQRQELEQYLRDMKEFELTVSSVSAWVSLGRTVQSFLDLPESYQGARRQMGERLLAGKNRLLEYCPPEAPGGSRENGQFWLADVRKTLENAVETFDEQTIHKTLEQLKSNLLSSTSVNGSSLHSIYKSISAIVSRELERNGINPDRHGLEYSAITKEWDYFWDVNDMFGCMESSFFEAVEILRQEEEDALPTPILLAKRYIRSYFDMPLSLQELSDYVGMNENYFSYYFKKNVNMTFKQYQAQLRIRHAKQLLLDKKLSLEDIAESVGYTDVKYFSRVFKQIAKVTPGEYRKKYHIIKD